MCSCCSQNRGTDPHSTKQPQTSRQGDHSPLPPCPPQGLSQSSGQLGSGMGRTTWQGRSWQVGQWEMPCVVRLRSWKMISSPWIRSSRTQPGGQGRVGGGRVSIWRKEKAGQLLSTISCAPFGSWGSITSQASLAGEEGRKAHLQSHCSAQPWGWHHSQDSHPDTAPHSGLSLGTCPVEVGK